MKKSRRSCRGIDGKKRGAEENARKNEEKWQAENSLHEVVSFCRIEGMPHVTEVNLSLSMLQNQCLVLRVWD
jgi:hypothetical protein